MSDTGQKVWDHGRVFWQTGDPEGSDVPEPAILVHVGSGDGCIVLQQEDQFIVLSRNAANLKAFKKVLDLVFSESQKG